MPQIEKIQIDYDFLVTYFNTALNVIGATTNTTLRTITAHNDANSIYVRKFGLDYEITDVTDIEDPVDVNMTFKVYALDGTLLGSRTGGGAFVDGSVVSSQGCYLEIEANGGAVTVLGTILIDTDVDPGGKDFVCAAETIADGDTLRLYLSDTTSTYYDSEYKYGGARHTPDSTSGLPYFDITTAIADPDVTGFTITTVLDSETYDEVFSISIASMILQAALGQTPTVTSGIGARITREVEHDGNNTDTKYVSKLTGNDANPGTYQEPYLTIQFAENNMGGLAYLNIMDSETYEENITINITLTIESLYGQIPAISGTGNIIVLGHNTVTIVGIIITGDNTVVTTGIHQVGGSGIDGFNGSIKNCTITECRNSCILISTNAGDFDGSIEKCIIANVSNDHIIDINDSAGSGSIENNIIYDGLANGSAGIQLHSFTGTSTVNILNNLIYDCFYGILVTYAAGNNYDGDIENNTIFNCTIYGIYFSIDDTAGGNYRNNIVWDSGTDDYFKEGIGANPTFTNSNYANSSGWTVGAGNIITDPDFINETSRNLALRVGSGAYRTDSNSDDMGVHFRIIEINESTIEINGFNIDGQEQYHNAIYILDSADHTGLSIKWCSDYDFQGTSIDPYDDDADTNVTISNCLIYDNGNGIKFSWGGNTVEECLIYNNTIYGIHSDRTGNTFNHNSFYNNQYAIYLESDSGAIIIKNNIFHSNSLYGIFSEVSIVVTYCDISDSALTANVDATDASNITANPLFQDLLAGAENFNLQTIEAGFTVNSLAKEVADDGKDMGAYDVSRGITDLGWKKYILDVNPNTTNERFNSEGFRQDRDVLGSPNTWEKNNKIIIPLVWSESQVTTKQQWNKIKYFASLRSSRQLGKTKQEVLMRYDAEPSVHKDTGTNAVITASTKILNDSAKSWDENEFRGYNVAVIFTSGAGMVIDAGAKTGTKAGAGWTVDEWEGYFLKYNGYTYYIKSNTATVLTLSDPYSTLVSDTIDYSIEKYFEINEMYDDEITLIDDDSELVDGTYDYYISFIKSRTLNSSFQFRQPGHDPTMEEWKTGYSLTLIQD